MDKALAARREVINQVLSKPYRRKIGRTTFQISSFGNSLTDKSGQDLLFGLIETEIDKNATKKVRTAL